MCTMLNVMSFPPVVCRRAHVIKNIENVSFDRYKRKWHGDLMINERSKLRTYRLFKNDYFKEKYLSENIPGKYKSDLQNLDVGLLQ